MRMDSSSGKSTSSRCAICSGLHDLAQRRSCRLARLRPFQRGATGPDTTTPSGRRTCPTRRSWTYSRSRSLATSLAVFGRRATSSAFHCATPARYSSVPLRVAALRRNSLEIVDGSRPTQRAISRTPAPCALSTAISSRSANDRYRPESRPNSNGDMPPPSRNQRLPAACDAPTAIPASSLVNPCAIKIQNSRSTSRRRDSAPGDFIGDLPVSSFIHPAGLPINTSNIKVLRRPVESSLNSLVAVMGQPGDVTPLALAGPDAHLQGVQREVGAQRGGQLPADHPPGEHVDHERGVDPSGERAAVGDVSDPQLVRAAGGEVAVDQVGPGVRPGPRDRRARALRSGDPPQTGQPHQPVDRAAGDPVALAVQLGVDLADPVDLVVGRMDVLDHRCGRRVGHRPRRGRSGPVGVVAARGDLQVPADRLDPERLLVLVDELDDHLDGRSSSAAKKADALRKIALDRRSSLTSRSSSANRAASDAVVPARSPASISAWLTHPRNVSGLIPSCSPTRCNAPGRVTGSRRASTAIRIARPRSSSGYFLGAAMTLILSGIESLHQTRHETYHPDDKLLAFLESQ